MEEFQTDVLRILAVDDEKAVLDSYREILGVQKKQFGSELKLEKLAATLFGEPPEGPQRVRFDLAQCRQGDRAVETVKKALDEERPFAVAFIDVRLPPGPDGVWAAEHIRAVDPNLQIVIVTAYSDVDPSEIAHRVPPSDKLLYVQKPFHPQEIRHFASALSAKWHAERLLRNTNVALEQRVRERTAALGKANDRLEEEIAQRRKREAELELKSRHLNEANTALKVLLRQRDDHKAEIEERVLSNMKELILPYVHALKQSSLDAGQKGHVDILESNLKELISPFSQKLSSEQLNLTPKEIRVANLVKEGKTTKEIAKLLGVSTNTIIFHRYHIRKKLGLKKRKVNLRSYLTSLS